VSGPTDLQLVAGVLLDVGLKSTVVLGVPLLLSRPLQRLPAASQHVVWAISLVVLPVLAARSAFMATCPAADLPWLPVVWGAGVLLALLPLVADLLRLAGVTRNATGEGLVRHAAVDGPLTWGHLRPVILLPHHPTWTDREHALVLAHEQAHIQRADWLVHIATRIVCAVFWFQPLVWLAWRRLGAAAEAAADDLVLHTGARPSVYASLLLRVATHQPRAALAVGKHPVHIRVMGVLASRPRSAQRRCALVFGTVLAAGVLYTAGTWTPWTLPPACLASPSPPPLLARTAP